MTNSTQTQKAEKKEDRRVRRTKKLLTQALTKLLQEKQVKDITVKELTELADMNRGTFYLYYKDVYDMLEKLEDNMFSALDQILEPQKGRDDSNPGKAILVDLFRFIDENQEMCRLLLSPHGDMKFLHRINLVLWEKCRENFRAAGFNAEAEDLDYRYNFVVFGCAGVIRTWVNQNCQESPEEMAELTIQMMRGAKVTGEKDRR